MVMAEAPPCRKFAYGKDAPVRRALRSGSSKREPKCHDGDLETLAHVNTLHAKAPGMEKITQGQPEVPRGAFDGTSLEASGGTENPGIDRDDLADPREPARKIDVLKRAQWRKPAQFPKRARPAKNRLVAKMPADGAIAESGQSAGEFEKARRAAKFTDERAANNRLIGERVFERLERARLKPSVGMKKNEDLTAGDLRAGIHLRGASGRRPDDTRACL
jgi:hypothetical protein